MQHKALKLASTQSILHGINIFFIENIISDAFSKSKWILPGTVYIGMGYSISLPD